MVKDNENNLLEELSNLEHEQWFHWAQTLLERMYIATLNRQSLEQFYNDMRKRWEPNFIPYTKLDEKTKEFDREWARKVLEKVNQDNGNKQSK